MKCQGINITTARIRGLNSPPFYFEAMCYYAWNLTFSCASHMFFHNLSFFRVGDSKEEGEITCNKIKKNFKKACIFEGNKVAVIFGNDHNIIAIGHTGKNLWIDVRDNFSKKTFKELNIVVTSLKVY